MQALPYSRLKFDILIRARHYAMTWCKGQSWYSTERAQIMAVKRQASLLSFLDPDSGKRPKDTGKS